MKKRIPCLMGLLACGGLISAALCLSSCQSASQPDLGMNVSPAMIAQDGAGRGAAEIWSATCTRCHNSRAATSLNDAEWDIAMMHMRIQANLTGDEYRSILEFLKASN